MILASLIGYLVLNIISVVAIFKDDMNWRKKKKLIVVFLLSGSLIIATACWISMKVDVRA